MEACPRLVVAAVGDAHTWEEGEEAAAKGDAAGSIRAIARRRRSAAWEWMRELAADPSAGTCAYDARTHCRL